MRLHLFEKQVYSNRRQILKQSLGSGLVILLGNEEVGMNYKHNWYPFRQDSTFLYYFGLNVAGLAASIDLESGEEIIYGNELTIDDIVWTGTLPTVKEMADEVGVAKTLAYSKIEVNIKNALSQNRKIHLIPQYRSESKLKLLQWLSISQSTLDEYISPELIRAIVNQRSYKEAREIAEMHKASNISAEMHLAAIQMIQPGLKEYEIVAKVKEVAYSNNASLSFPPIVTINGETLHNTYSGNTLKEGDMLLCDAGASNEMNYAGDLTTTTPVGKTFTAQQKVMYEIVLYAHKHAVSLLKPNVMYKDIYFAASQKIVEGLQSIGLMKGDANAAVEAGAHTLFFQCGLGHMIGLDVHDMENLGEQYVGYTDTLLKSTEFGLKSLRLGKNLEKNFTITVEPGIYMIPHLMDQWQAQNKCADFIRYNELDKYRNFHGIRIEEDYLITENGYQLLGKKLPIEISEIEAFRH